MPRTLPKSYDPTGIEDRWAAYWVEESLFSSRPARMDEPVFTVILPPPNVTGRLHMGHMLNQTEIDILVRWRRMRGEQVLWVPGTDHAGIATQMMVERQLAAEGKERSRMGREAFVERVWDWKRHYGGAILEQMKRLGVSVDWSREYFTMDAGLSMAVREAFVRLYEQGLIYRAQYVVNWCPRCQTAISDLEVAHEEQEGKLWEIRYPLAGETGAGETSYVTVATTRPETLLGDVAVAVHPEDERYRWAHGRRLRLPLLDREIPVIVDPWVSPEFGTGAVKVTPAHDANDFAIGRRHGLEAIAVMDETGHMNAAAGPYAGLERYQARKRILADLEENGLLAGVREHANSVGKCDRCKTVVEPRLSMQWFLKVAPLAEKAIAAVEQGFIRFTPDQYARTYFEWMRNIHDWCISRQLWWGHQIPAWYGPDGRIFVARHEEEAQTEAARHYGMPVPLERDPDVLDTWFSSALWPFTTLGWPEKNADIATFYPTSVLVTGFDIIFFWVARMIMMGLRFLDDVPFHEVYVHGLVRDSEGQKMSKSKGNVLDPLDLIDGITLDALVAKRTQGLMQPQMAGKIEKATRKEFPAGIPAFGTDALRFTFAALATQGRDIKFDLKRVEGNRNFCNKLWNASRYALMQVQAVADLEGDSVLLAPDRWIIGRLQETEAAVAEAFAQYRFSDAAQALYQFFWNDYCDWYIELSKPVLRGEGDFGAAEQRGARNTLLKVLEAGLRLLHPVMPFLTEELWQRVAPVIGKGGESISLAAYPRADLTRIDGAADGDVQWLVQVIRALRSVRGEMDIPLARPLPVLLQGGTAQDRERVQRLHPWLHSLARTASLDWLDADAMPPPAALQLVDELKILVPLAGVIDVAAEQARIAKEITRVAQDLEKAQSKLAQPDFRNRAPAAVVERELARVEELGVALEELKNQHQRLDAL